MQQIILGLLMAIVSLYQNPKVQADPAMLAQVNSMFAAVAPMMQETTANQPTSQVTFSIPTSTKNNQPIVINVNPPAEQQSTPILLGANQESTVTETMASYYMNPSYSIQANVTTQNMCIVIFDQDGNPITDASATISTDSLVNAKDANGNILPLGSNPDQVYDTYNFAKPSPGCQYQATLSSPFQPAMGYFFMYDAPSVGTHYMNVSALGSSLPVTVDVMPQ